MLQHVQLVQLFQLLVQHGFLLLNLVSICVDFLELLGKVRKALEELFDHDYSEHQPLSISSEGLNHELEGDSLQDIVQQLVLDNRTEKLGNLLEIGLRVLMEEAILIEEAVEDTGIDLLLLHHL